MISAQPSIFSYVNKHSTPKDLENFLTKFPSQLEERQKQSGRTPLLIAVHGGYTDNVEKLIVLGANMEAVDHCGLNVFHCVLDRLGGEKPSQSTLGVLIHYLDSAPLQKLLSAPNGQGQTPLDFAITMAAADQVNYSSAIHLLLQHDAPFGGNMLNTTSEHLRNAHHVLSSSIQEECWSRIAAIRARQLNATLTQSVQSIHAAPALAKRM